MEITELLVTGFSGDTVVLATDLTADCAATFVAGTGTAEAGEREARPAFLAMVAMLDELAGAAEHDSV